MSLKQLSSAEDNLSRGLGGELPMTKFSGADRRVAQPHHVGFTVSALQRPQRKFPKERKDLPLPS